MSHIKLLLICNCMYPSVTPTAWDGDFCWLVKIYILYSYIYTPPKAFCNYVTPFTFPHPLENNSVSPLTHPSPPSYYLNSSSLFFPLPFMTPSSPTYHLNRWILKQGNTFQHSYLTYITFFVRIMNRLFSYQLWVFGATFGSNKLY